MTEDVRAPLAQFAGAVPPAPAWFDAAIAHAPERSIVIGDGGPIELLTWGDRGKPGLLLMHGSGAHAGWWSFIAPFFAADYRVAAFSWAGMGGSAHRERYDIGGFVAQIMDVATTAGLFEAATKPVLVAHSFGGYPMMAAAARHGDRFKAAVIVDTPFRAPGEGGRPATAIDRPHRVYPTLVEALARFRFAPTQGCANLYVADHIARGSLVEVPGGWQWAFDPLLWSRFDIGEPREVLRVPKCPVALIWGDRSALMTPAMVTRMRDMLPPGTPAFAVPDADHHVMVDQPLAFVAGLRGLLSGWPQPTGVGA